MYDGHDWMWGMHWGWWIFWILLILIAIFVFRRGTPGGTAGHPRETPLDVLQRRYAAGEISTEEYEERKGRLERDRSER